MMSIMIKIRFVCLLVLTVSFQADGSSIVKVPERLFQLTGSEVNVSEGTLLYKSQAAGYYTGGGGMVVRSPIKNAQLMSIQVPKMPSAGCGGIDIYTGGFSFISDKQLIETLQAVSSNAMGFAFMLGLESVSPSASNTMRQLQSWANTINGIGINSCETAATLVGSVWPANEMASQHICRTANTSNPIYQDYIQGRHKCSNKGVENGKTPFKSDLPMAADFNIAWEALMVQPFFKKGENKTLAEMYMTLVGTFIVTKDDPTPKFHYSKASDNEFLRKLLEGGKVTRYICGDKNCLSITEVDQEILIADSWFVRIRRYLMDIQDKVIKDQPLDDGEKGLLQTSRLPIFKIINVLTAHQRGRPCTTELDNLADIISWDVLAQILNEAIETVRRGCIQLRETSMYANKIDNYMTDLEHVRKVVHRYEEHAKKGIDLEMRLIQKMQLLEKQINSEIMVD